MWDTKGATVRRAMSHTSGLTTLTPGAGQTQVISLTSSMNLRSLLYRARTVPPKVFQHLRFVTPYADRNKKSGPDQSVTNIVVFSSPRGGLLGWPSCYASCLRVSSSSNRCFSSLLTLNLKGLDWDRILGVPQLQSRPFFHRSFDQ
jgi:hypothetical protein